MKKILIGLFFLIPIAIIGIIFLLKPINLGISYSSSDLQSAKRKLSVSYESLPINTPIEKSLVVSGAHPVDQTFSSQEITALVDNRQKEYIYFPFQNVQIRINNDGSVEGSATVQFAAAVNYLTALGVSAKDIAQAQAKFHIPNTNLPVYLKVLGSVVNNQSQIVVREAKIAHIGVPKNIINQYNPSLNRLIESVIRDRQPSYNIEKLVVENGKIHFVGTSPDKELAVKQK